MDTSMSFALMPPPDQPWQGSAHRYSAREWEERRSEIQRLYIEEDRKAKDVISALSEAGFVVTEKQLKDRLKKWKINTKNVKEDNMLAIARTRLKRQRVENKESAFRVNKQAVKEVNIDRFLKRKNISEDTLLSMATPASAPSPAFSVFTPQPPTPDAGQESSSQFRGQALSMLSRGSTPNPSHVPSSPNRSITAASPAPSFSWIQRTSTPFTGQSPAPFPSTPFSEHDIGNETNHRENEPYQQRSWSPSASEITGANAGLDYRSTVPEDSRSIRNHSTDTEPELPATAADLEEGSIVKKVALSRERRCFQDEEDQCREQLAAAELMHGPESEQSLHAVIEVAFVLRKQGRYKSAETLISQAIETKQKVLGIQNCEILNAFAWLGVIFIDQGRYRSSEKVFRQILTTIVKSKQLKYYEQLVLFIKSELAFALFHQKRFMEASDIQRKVLATLQRNMGFEHPHTLKVMESLANCLDVQGYRSGIFEMYRKLLEIQKRTLGEDDKDIIRTKLHFSISLKNEGQLDASERLMREVLAARKRIMGSGHPEVLKVERELCICMGRQRRYEEAGFLAQKVWLARRRVLGDEHPLTKQSVEDLAQIGIPQQRARHEDVQAKPLITANHNEDGDLKMAPTINPVSFDSTTSPEHATSTEQHHTPSPWTGFNTLMEIEPSIPILSESGRFC